MPLESSPSSTAESRLDAFLAFNDRRVLTSAGSESKEDAEDIAALQSKLALLKDQKRFLLNNLVTGTIRLPEFAGPGGK